MYMYTNTTRCPDPSPPIPSCRPYTFFLSIFTARRGGSFSARGAQLVDLHDAFGADPWEISGGKRRVQRWTRSRVHIIPISGASARTRDYLARSAGPIAALTYQKGGPRYQLESQLICAW